ncbi:MAG: putative Nudix hydrolase NudL, partial [Pseudomonadota bacterium]
MADQLKRVFENPPAWSPELQHEPALGHRPPRAAAVLIPIVLRG